MGGLLIISWCQFKAPLQEVMENEVIAAKILQELCIIDLGGQLALMARRPVST